MHCTQVGAALIAPSAGAGVDFVSL